MTNERPKVPPAANRCAKVSPPEGVIEKNRGKIYILTRCPIFGWNGNMVYDLIYTANDEFGTEMVYLSIDINIFTHKPKTDSIVIS